jgi:hypothetical protein
MTEEERALVVRLLRDAGLTVLGTQMLTDGSLTVRVARMDLRK